MLGHRRNARHLLRGDGRGPSLVTRMLAFTAAASLALVGVVGLAVAPGAVADDGGGGGGGGVAAPSIGTGDGDVTFCHRSSSAGNPYTNLQTTSFESFKRGHGDHTGPVFPAPDWGDIYPPNNFRPLGQNWDAVGQAIFNNGCNINIPVVPVNPQVVQAACTAPGVAGLPSIGVPPNSSNISYTLAGNVVPGGTATVTASPVPPQVFTMTAPAGWVLNRDGTASFTVVFAVPDCTFGASPAPPVVAQAQCTAPGVASAPSLTLAATEGISYTQSGPAAQGATVTVTATPQTGYKLAPAGGWTPQGNGTATFTVTFATVDCIVKAAPVAPTVVQAVCTGPGTATTPSVVPAETAGITYSITGTVAQGSTVTVTATPLPGYSLAPAAGWVEGPNGSASYTFTVVLDTVDCIVKATPVAPAVVQAVCTGPGTATTPTVDPVATTGINYSVAGTVAQGSTVTVTATPLPGYSLAPAAGWVAGPDGSASYTFTVRLATIDCTVTTLPAAPNAVQAVCTGPGTATTPTLAFASTAGVSYSQDKTAAAGVTVTVTATPAFGYKLSAAEGWTLNEDGTAALTVVFSTPDCIVETTPAVPTATQAVCTGPGTDTAPGISVPQDSESISYSVNGAMAQGSTVHVIATPAAGYRLAAGNGWSLNEDGTASFKIEFATVNCIVDTTPEIPTFVQQSCTGPGATSGPSMSVPANSDGISYTVAGTATPGGTVTITATQKAGYKLVLPANGFALLANGGWVLNGDGTATFSFTFDPAPDCIFVAVPVAPLVTQSVCTGPGTDTVPTAVLATTTGISYSQDVDAETGTTVVVTATPNAGYTLGTAEGWTLKEGGTATLTIVFTTPDCIVEATPATPTATQAVCTGPGAATTPTVTLPADTESISYTTSGTPAQGGTAYVLATPAEGYKLQAGNGWSLNEDGTASYTVEFSTVDCIVEATPAAPTANQAVCTGPGTTSTPSLDLGTTEGITYSQDVDAAAGATVKVTATPNTGYELAGAEGWTPNEDGTATFTIVFSTPDCVVEATPAAPTATQAVCTGPGTATTPALDLGTTEGITYSQDIDAAAGATVKVTATPDTGYKLAGAEGWTLNEDGTAAFTIVFSTPNCVVEATPAAPTATQAVCSNGAVTAPTLVLASTNGIEYTASGAAANGKAVTVTATPDTGYKLAEAANWTSNKDGSATFTAAFNEVKCPVVAPAAAAPPAPLAAPAPAPLAMTGMASGWSVSLAALFLVLGAGAVWRSRRPADR